jgi:hypothetical protein
VRFTLNGGVGLKKEAVGRETICKTESQMEKDEGRLSIDTMWLKVISNDDGSLEVQTPSKPSSSRPPCNSSISLQ